MVPVEPQQSDAAGRQPHVDASVRELLDDVGQKRLARIEAVGEERLVATEVHRLHAVDPKLVHDPVDHLLRHVTTLDPGVHAVAVSAAVRAVVAESPADVADRRNGLRQITELVDRADVERVVLEAIEDAQGNRLGHLRLSYLPVAAPASMVASTFTRGRRSMAASPVPAGVTGAPSR